MELAVRNRIKYPRLLAALVPYFRRKRILLTAATAVILLLIAGAISLFIRPGNGFLPYLQNIEVIPHQGTLAVAIDDTLLPDTIAAEKCEKLRASIDGTIAAFLTERKELYLVQGKSLKKIADDVLHFEISSTGQGVAFAQKFAEQYALTLYSVKEQKRTEITNNLFGLDFSLSPDGKTVAFYTQNEDRSLLMCHYKGNNLTVTLDNCDLVGLSDDGDYIYAVCPKITGTTSLLVYNIRGGSAELGQVTSSSFKFNADHRQIMFYNNGKTMISNKGRTAIKASTNPLYLVTAPNNHSTSDGNAITFPVKSLFGHIYTCSDGETTGAWLIQKNPEKSIRLATGVSGSTLDSTAEYLYYIKDLKQLCVLQIADGSKASEKARVLAEDVITYAVTSDRSKVYFTTQKGLYSTNGKKAGIIRLISSDYTGSLPVLSAADVVYYLCENQLYACKNGKKGTLEAQNIQSVYSSPNSVVYILGSDSVYTAYNRKQVSRLLGSD